MVCLTTTPTRQSLKHVSTQCEVSLGSALRSALRCGVEGDLFVRTSLIDFYGKCKHIFSARELFDDMSDKNVRSEERRVGKECQ